jgi:hypothetical protein
MVGIWLWIEKTNAQGRVLHPVCLKERFDNNKIKSQSKAYQGGNEEAKATQACLMCVSEPDDAANACRRMNATWYKEESCNESFCVVWSYVFVGHCVVGNLLPVY